MEIDISMNTKETTNISKAIRILDYMHMLTTSLKAQNNLLQTVLGAIKSPKDQSAQFIGEIQTIDDKLSILDNTISDCVNLGNKYKNSQLVSFEKQSQDFDQFNESGSKYVSKNLGLSKIYIDDRLINEELLNKLESAENKYYFGDERFNIHIKNSNSPIHNSSSRRLDQIMNYDNYKFKRINCKPLVSSSTCFNGKVKPSTSNNQPTVDIPDEMINNSDDSKSVITLSDKNIPDQLKMHINQDLKKLSIKDISKKYKLSETAIKDIIIENELKMSFENIKAGNNKIFKHHETERKILRWMKEEYETKGIFYSEYDIRARAREISVHKDFMASNSWFYRFKSRYPYFFEKYFHG